MTVASRSALPNMCDLPASTISRPTWRSTPHCWCTTTTLKKLNDGALSSFGSWMCSTVSYCRDNSKACNDWCQRSVTSRAIIRDRSQLACIVLKFRPEDIKSCVKISNLVQRRKEQLLTATYVPELLSMWVQSLLTPGLCRHACSEHRWLRLRTEI